MTGWRKSAGATVDQSKPISFSWAGRPYRGFAGDTLASALIANGVSVIGRSFKYHRLRGLLAAGLEEPNGIVQLELGAVTVPNVKATQVELYEGLSAGPVNSRPSAEFDLLAGTAMLKRFIPAAFYYKTFFWPSWSLFEPAIRQAAGLGVAPAANSDPDTYEHRFAHIDLLVIGSGGAGLAAAEAAAAQPVAQRVMLVEADAEFGGGPLSAQAAAPAAGRQIEVAGLSFAWMAPGEWLISGPQAVVAQQVATPNEAGGDEALIVDLTHARAAFRLSGTDARDVPAAYCPLDLWTKAFPVGAAARSLLGQTGLFIARLADLSGGAQFRIVVDQTMGPYAARMLALP